ncbi:EamA/RhaT family transporter [Candidatus Woesearchaeota archaeon]|nr:EamA/RhaT family transporter [Candidatus Woesearchaeota archaeon]MBW3021835.1 EamA/RhaT family transporter [Candidatus Woesearchaeota archaeon]
MNKGTKIGIAVMIISSLFLSTGQLFFKYGSGSFKWNIMSIITNYNYFFALCFCGIGAVLLIIALKFGDLSVMFPLVSISYIFVILISYFILHEDLGLLKLFAIGFIAFGVTLITKGDENG